MIGKIVTLYWDEFNTEIIGKAKLLKLISKGLPIILPSDTDYESPTDKQLVYRFDKYKVQFVDGYKDLTASGIYKVRILHNIGKVANKEEFEFKNLPKDSFLTVNGKEIF